MTSTAFMKTRSGGLLDLFNPDPQAIYLEDIAHSLSNLCRFNGHCPEFYSVAQHSVLVSVFSEYPREALLHDAAEAYVTDLIRPLKCNLPEFQKVEWNLLNVIAERFGISLDEITGEDVKLADERVLLAEYEDFYGNRPVEVAPELSRTGIPHVRPMEPEFAKALFLSRANDLCLKEVSQW